VDCPKCGNEGTLDVRIVDYIPIVNGVVMFGSSSSNEPSGVECGFCSALFEYDLDDSDRITLGEYLGGSNEEGGSNE
jgi:hypothetical protein